MAKRDPVTGRTERRRKRFLEVLSKTANVTKAAEQCKVSRQTFYEWRADDPEFARQWDAAYEQGLDTLEDEALRRGADGYDETTHERNDDGELVPVKRVHKYSDTLLMFMLNGRRGHVFKSRHEHSGPGGGPIHTVQRTIVDPGESPASDSDDDDGSSAPS